MFRHITMLVTSILLVFGMTACTSSPTEVLSVPDNLNFEGGEQSIEGPTRITWPDREIIFYTLTAESQEFMMVDLMGDRAIEYILRNGRLEEARFSLPDGSLVRFDLVGLHDSDLAPVVHHCTAHSSAIYQLEWLPKNLAHSIGEFNARFSNWNTEDAGTLYLSKGTTAVPYERILEKVCSGVGML